MKKNEFGIIININNKKTIILLSKKLKFSKKYNKKFFKHTTYMVHDEQNIAQVGDYAIISEHIPISKRKKWVLNKIFI